MHALSRDVFVLAGPPSLLSVHPNTTIRLGPFRVPPRLREPSWLDSANIWSLGLLLPKRHRFCAIFSISLYYIIPGAGPICWMGKASSCWLTWGAEIAVPSPHALSAGFLFPSQTWEQLVFVQPSDVSSCSCFLFFFFLVFPDPSCGAQGRASDRAAKGRWSKLRSMDM